MNMRPIATAIGRTLGRSGTPPWMAYVATRNILTFTAASSQYGELVTPITFAGDFDYTVSLALSVIGLNQLTGIHGGDRLYVGCLATTGKWLFGLGSTTYEHTTGADGKIHKLTTAKRGSDYLCYLDGGLVHTEVGAATRTVFDLVVGANNDNNGIHDSGEVGSYCDDQILSVGLTDLATPANSRYYRMNSGSALYELAQGTALGATVVDSGFESWLEQGTWDVVGGIASAVAEGGWLYSPSDVLEANRAYLVTFTVDSVTAGGVRSRAQNGSTGITHTSVGTCFDVITTTAASIMMLDAEGFTGSSSNMIVQPLPATAMLYKNFTASNWERFRRTFGPNAWTALDGSPVLEFA